MPITIDEELDAELDQSWETDCCSISPSRNAMAALPFPLYRMRRDSLIKFTKSGAL